MSPKDLTHPDAAGDRPADVPLADLPWRAERYAPIGDYAIIGDTLSTALVAKDGALEWLCLPNFDDGAIFAGLLDCRRGGKCFVGPRGPARTSRSYIDGTPILRTRHETEGGVFEVVDFMPLALGGQGGLRPERRVVRAIEVLEGRPEVAVNLSPRPDWGATMPKLRQVGARAWRLAGGRDFLLVQCGIPMERVAEGTLAGSARLEKGDRIELTLSYTGGGPGILPAAGAADRERQETERYWRDLVETIDYEGPFREAVHRSLITLHLLTFSHSGAVIAAATANLPEVIGGMRNFDYRFCWLRDASFVLEAFLALGMTTEGEGFFRWLMHATRKTAPELGTFYSIFGESNLGSRVKKSLEGYRGSAPVTVGNGAESQLQLDAYGSMLAAARYYVEAGGVLDDGEGKRLAGYARTALESWTLPDNGLWEMPDPRRHFTYSKVMCWAALDAIADLAQGGAVPGRAVPCDEAERARIRDHLLQAAWSEKKQAFAGSLGADWLDASVLLMPRMKIIDANDPRMVATYEAVRRDLGEGPVQIRRYPPGFEGLPGREGSFTVCGFWAGDYLARAGRLEEAEAQIGGMIDQANDLGLMAEELDPESGAQLGNFPQGFSHAGMISAARALAQAQNTKGEKTR